MEVTGIVLDVQEQYGTSRAGKEWSKNVVVIEYTEGLSTKHLAVDLFGSERIANNPCQKGDEVTVQFEINSNEYNGRWFTSANALRISQVRVDEKPAKKKKSASKLVDPVYPDTYPTDSESNSYDEDLPF